MSSLVNSLKTKDRCSRPKLLAGACACGRYRSLVEPPVDSVHRAVSPRVRRITACVADPPHSSLRRQLLLTPQTVNPLRLTTVSGSGSQPQPMQRGGDLSIPEFSGRCQIASISSMPVECPCYPCRTCSPVTPSDARPMRAVMSFFTKRGRGFWPEIPPRASADDRTRCRVWIPLFCRGGTPSQTSSPRPLGAVAEMRSHLAPCESHSAAPAAQHSWARRAATLNFRVPPSMVRIANVRLPNCCPRTIRGGRRRVFKPSWSHLRPGR
jgi:hypothetical protein